MALTPGTRIGPFEIQGALGAGGMGEVYRARDSRLRREVAIKVLPDSLAGDADRTARFQREATILASLNHPNIAAIYGVEEAGGVHALVLELVDGPTLAERIRSGPLPVPDALAIATAIADALESAHEAGIVHRDLKPANVKLRRDGTVKVLDFGLAKALQGDAVAAGADEETATEFATGRGFLLGTAAYMSPEQARGDQVDGRADIWAFGCVLFEMLTGHRTFVGDRTADIVAAVMREAPDWQRLPVDTPAAIRRLLRRCLEKDPRSRLRHIGDARLELREAASSTGPEPVRQAAPQNPRAWGRSGVWLAAGLLAGMALGAMAWSGLARPAVPASPPARRLSMTFPTNAIEGVQAQSAFSGSSGIALSPDGTRVVYVGQSGTRARQLYVRPFTEFDSRPLNGTEGATAPFFSPDGESVGFFAAGKLKRIRLADEAISTICDAPEDTGGSGGAWSSDGTIVFAVANIARTGLFRVPATGGTPDALTTPDPDEEGGHGDPSFVAGDRALVFATRFSRAGVATSIRAVVLATREQRRLVEGGSRPRYAASGHLVYGAGNRLMAAPFDPDRLVLTGPATPVIEPVDAENFDVSRSGTLVYHPQIPSGGRPVWVDRRGSIEPIPLDEDRAVGRPRLSPDGSRAVMEVWRESRGDIAVFQFNNGVLTFLTSDGRNNNSPAWHPDGRRIVYRRSGSLFVQAVDGGTREVFLDAADPGLKGTSQLAPGVFTRDGSTYAFVVHGSTEAAADIWTMRTGAKPALSGVVQRPGNQWGVRVSPDGRWISYASDESGRFEIWVEPIAGGGARYQVSRGGGKEAVWSADGSELFYRSGDRVLAVPVTGQPGSPTGVPQVLFTGRFASTDIPDYDVSRDGKRFLMLQPIQNDVESQTLRVVDNWFVDLRRLAPAGGK